jgi:hypothetical protein
VSSAAPRGLVGEVGVEAAELSGAVASLTEERVVSLLQLLLAERYRDERGRGQHERQRLHRQGLRTRLYR